MNKEVLRKLFICSHQWAREMVDRYEGIDYNAQLRLCMKELLRQKKNNEHNLF